MSKGVQTIRVKNFKAFSKKEVLQLNGKNLLVYGENGSGKSSLYFALYTFLQCSQANKNYKKYFSQTNKESLLNINVLKDSSFIEVIAKENRKKAGTFRLSHSSNNLRSATLIKEMNLASDFISHRLLVGFYNFRNSTEINLFSVFERDIFPYFDLTTPKGKEYFSDVFKQLKEQLPITKIGGKIVLAAENSGLFANYETLLNTFNTALETLIQSVNSQATEYYRDNFNAGNEDLQIFLQLKEKLSINKVIERNELNDPFIKLYITRKVGLKFVKIDRPQSYLNEAKLTAIALSIRFSLLERRPVQVDTKILALDDLLVSLDMSHRENILTLVLDKYSKQYQLIILTHDRQFFYLAKNHIKLKKEMDDWALYEMYADDRKGYERPFISSFKTNLERAEAYMLSFQFPAAANALRTHLEEFLETITPLQERVTNDGYAIKDFSLIDKVIAFLKKCSIVTTDLELAKKHKDVSLNPLSHFDTERQVYRKELDDCITLMKKLQNSFKHFRAKRILKVGDELNFELHEGAIIHQFTIQVKVSIYIYTNNGTDILLSIGGLKLNWQTNGAIHPHSISKSNLPGLLNEVCRQTHNPLHQDPFLVYRLANGDLLNTLKVF